MGLSDLPQSTQRDAEVKQSEFLRLLRPAAAGDLAGSAQSQTAAISFGAQDGERLLHHHLLTRKNVHDHHQSERRRYSDEVADHHRIRALEIGAVRACQKEDVEYSLWQVRLTVPYSIQNAVPR